MAEGTVRFESEVVIQRPVREVFERLADLPGYRGWMHRTWMFRRCSTTSDTPVDKGNTYVDATRMGRFEGEVTAYDAPTRRSVSRRSAASPSLTEPHAAANTVADSRSGATPDSGARLSAHRISR